MVKCTMKSIYMRQIVALYRVTPKCLTQVEGAMSWSVVIVRIVLRLITNYAYA